MTTHVTQHTQSGQGKPIQRGHLFFPFSLLILFFFETQAGAAATLRFIAGTLHNWEELEIILETVWPVFSPSPPPPRSQHRFSFLPINNSKRHSRIPFHARPLPPSSSLSACLRLWVPIRNSCAGIYQSLFPFPPLLFHSHSQGGTCFGVDFA